MHKKIGRFFRVSNAQTYGFVGQKYNINSWQELIGGS
jgi:hypothetical protein